MKEANGNEAYLSHEARSRIEEFKTSKTKNETECQTRILLIKKHPCSILPFAFQGRGRETFRTNSTIDQIPFLFFEGKFSWMHSVWRRRNFMLDPYRLKPTRRSSRHIAFKNVIIDIAQSIEEI